MQILLLLWVVVLGLCGSLIQVPRAAAQGGEAVIGMWSRIAQGSQGYQREIIEFGQDGTYVVGICLTQRSLGSCKGPATPVRQGSYAVQGSTLILETSGGSREMYEWAVEERPDTSPSLFSNRPVPRVLYLTDAYNQNHQFNSMVIQPSWGEPARQQSYPEAAPQPYPGPPQQSRAERCCMHRHGWCKPWALEPGRYAPQVDYAELNSSCYCPGDAQGAVGQVCP
jgi:hypothetical protein